VASVPRERMKICSPDFGKDSPGSNGTDRLRGIPNRSTVAIERALTVFDEKPKSLTETTSNLRFQLEQNKPRRHRPQSERDP